MGTFLTRFTWTFSTVFDEGSLGNRHTRFVELDGGETATAIVCDGYGPAGGIDSKMARSLAACGCLTEEFQALARVDRKGCDGAGCVGKRFLGRSAGIEDRLGGMKCEKARVLIFRSEFRLTELAGF